MRFSLLAATIASVIVLAPTSAFAVRFRIPTGFRELERKPGVILLQRRRDFVQVVSPQDGARLHVLHGNFVEEGLYGTFARRDINEWWKEWKATTPRAYSMFNGQFFDASKPDTAPLAFSIKSNGRVFEGYADQSEYAGQKLMILLGPNGYTTMPYDDNPDTLLHRPEPDIIVGLSPLVAKTSAKPLPRTFIGTTRDGRAIIFSASVASQATAVRALRSFGIDPHAIVMLDGGNSSHLIQNGTVLVPRSIRGEARGAREHLPQVMAVESGS